MRLKLSLFLCISSLANILAIGLQYSLTLLSNNLKIVLIYETIITDNILCMVTKSLRGN